MATVRTRMVPVVAAMLVLAACAGGGDPGGAASATFAAADIEFTEAPDQVPAGEVTVELVNDGRLEHNVTIEELGDEVVVEAAGGQSATGSVTLDPGTYTYYCSVPGHREAGMEGTLTVE